MLWGLCAGPLLAQPGAAVSSSQFELSETVQLDQVDHAVLAQWERAKALLADRQWDEAIDILGQLAEPSEGKLLAVTNRRYVSLRAWCQLQLAALPPEALKLYRHCVDPIAQKWYRQGMAERNRRLLQKIVDQAFASRYGDKALMALGDMALEAGDFAAARWYWERIVPSVLPAGAARTWPGYPDTDLDLAPVRARLVLTSILAAAEAKKSMGTSPISQSGSKAAGQKLDLSPSSARARQELAEFVRLHPDARGRLGGQEGKYADLLQTLLAESVAWPPAASDPNWATFAGNVERNRIALRLADVGAVSWRIPLRPSLAATGDRLFEPRTASENPHDPLNFHPLQIGNMVLVNDSGRILALRLDTGRPVWGRAAIYESQLSGLAPPSPPSDMLGAPRFTLTCFRDKLFARMGSPVTGQPQGATTTIQPGCLVCLDLAAEGRLTWKISPEEGWAFEGSPVADAHGVYLAMRRQDIRPQVSVACFDADTGRLRWRRFICGADTPARGMFYESTHHLLTLSGETLYYNTNLGAVAAVRADDGYPLWVSLYPRARRGDLSKLPPHWRRELTPCVFDGGTLLVAPADSPRIFAFDAATGQALWQTGSEVEDVDHLLGVAGDCLIAGGRKLYWISLKDEDRGRVKHVWPEGADQPPGYGRGVLAGASVLWPTRDKLYLFDQQTAQPQKSVDLRAHGVSGGNLLPADGQLLIATEAELIAIGPHGRSTPPPPMPLAVTAFSPQH
jgi:outer membrane protein assembly factor BamB